MNLPQPQETPGSKKKVLADLRVNILGLRNHDIVEQDALMSPNPGGKHEDLVVGCVCVLSSCLKLVNSLLKLIQVHLNH